MGKRELVALPNLSTWCLVMVERLFLAVPRVCLRFVIVVFPDHTHLLFYRDEKRLDSLCVVVPLFVGVLLWSLFLFCSTAVLSVLSSFPIILVGNRGLFVFSLNVF